MRFRSRMGWGAAALLGLAGWLGDAAVCNAQLLPRLPIQRQRVECDQEAPFNKYVRQNFYGYYPTCWRTFPAGWACPCPNPELPNWEKSKRELPLQLDLYKDDLDDGMGFPGEGMDEPAPGRRPARPNVPDRVPSPFEMDDNPIADPPALPGRDRPLDRNPAPRGGAASFRRTPKPAADAPATLPALPPTEPTSPAPVTGLPELPALPDAPQDGRVNPTSLPVEAPKAAPASRWNLFRRTSAANPR